MHDQVYRYLDLPGQVCENTANISKHCVNTATAATSSQLCVRVRVSVRVCVCVLIDALKSWRQGVLFSLIKYV